MTRLFRLIPLLAALSCSIATVPVLAQAPAEFPPNPLESQAPDPLLPRPPVNRPLSPLELQTLRDGVEALNRQASAEYAAGNKIQAFAIWNRELRLRRVLGPLNEVTALGRVGAIAWKENESFQVRIITKRLQAIQQQTTVQHLSQPTDAVTLQQAIAKAYLQVRNKALAVEVYEQVLADAQQQQNRGLEGTVLATIAELHLHWFDYAAAATRYQEVLTFLRANPRLPIRPISPDPEIATPRPGTPSSDDPLTDISVLQKLAYIYDQSKQPAEAIAIRQELIVMLQERRLPAQIPAVQLAIGSNYEAVGQIDQAIEAYQQAYLTAQPLQQFGYASDALKRLGDFYQAQNQLDSALQIYEFLLDVEKQSYNYYGSMNTYDQMGRIYLVQQRYSQARSAFQQGLLIAQQLKFREAYFLNQINQIPK